MFLPSAPFGAPPGHVIMLGIAGNSRRRTSRFVQAKRWRLPRERLDDLMNHLTRQRAIQLAAAALALPTSALGQSTPPSVTIRVGSQPAEFTADMVYAMQLGFFEREGITIQLQMMTNGAATSAAILGGSLDVGLTDPLTVAEAHVRGIDLAFIAPGAAFATPWPLAFATHPDLGVREAKDLNGKTIATNALRNAPALMSYYWIDHNGGSSQTVKWIEVPFPAGVAAIQSKRIDGELFGEPFVSQARDAGLTITTMEHNTPAPIWMVNGWMTTRTWANQNVETVRRFARAIRAANLWANAHVAETVPIVSRFTHLPETTIKGMIPHPWIDGLQAALVQPVLDTCVSYGVLGKAVAARDIFYTVR
jgi:NitT/TauT family transport system substrate-binding protein